MKNILELLYGPFKFSFKDIKFSFIIHERIDSKSLYKYILVDTRLGHKDPPLTTRSLSGSLTPSLVWNSLCHKVSRIFFADVF